MSWLSYQFITLPQKDNPVHGLRLRRVCAADCSVSSLMTVREYSTKLICDPYIKSQEDCYVLFKAK